MTFGDGAVAQKTLVWGSVRYQRALGSTEGYMQSTRLASTDSEFVVTVTVAFAVSSRAFARRFTYTAILLSPI